MRKDLYPLLYVASIFCVLRLDTGAALAQARCANGNDHIEVELYIRRKCESCDVVRIFFLRKRLAPIEHSLDDLYWLHDLRTRTGQEKAPSIYACGEWVFGFDNPESIDALYRLYNVRSAHMSD